MSEHAPQSFCNEVLESANKANDAHNYSLNHSSPEAEAEFDWWSERTGAIIEMADAMPEIMPRAYRETVAARYLEIQNMVNQRIEEGILPEQYKLLGLNEILLNRLKTLIPTYEIMEDRNWQPEIVFVPQGLKFRHWNKLLVAYDDRLTDFDEGEEPEGLYHSWIDDQEIARQEVKDTSIWDVAVVSAADNLPSINISRESKLIPNSRYGIKKLMLELPGINKTLSWREIIEKVSPTEEIYCALQMALLEREKPPVDSGTPTTRTLLRDGIIIRGRKTQLCANRDPVIEEVGIFMAIYSSDRSRNKNRLNIRPSVRSRDLTISA